jgi:hypothetical protein
LLFILRRHFRRAGRCQEGKTPLDFALCKQKGNADCACLLEIDADAVANNTVRIQRFASDTQEAGAYMLLCTRLCPLGCSGRAATGRTTICRLRRAAAAPTAALLKHLTAEAAHVDAIFIRTTSDVVASTGDKQHPWHAHCLTHEHVCLY